MKRRFCLFAAGFLLLCASCGQPAPPEASSGQPSVSRTASAGETSGGEPSSPPLSITEDLLPVEEYSDPRQEDITHIVLHFMSAVVVQPQDPYAWGTVRQILLDGGVSTHYAIRRDGVIMRLIPEERVAWHAGKGTWKGDDRYTNRMNQYAVGIELLGIGTQEEMALYLTLEEYAEIPETLRGFTPEQYTALEALIADICARHPGVLRDRDHILGHSEYAPRKADPGALFDWARIGLA